MILKPENEIQGKHKIFNRHGDLFSYLIELSPTSWTLGMWRNSENHKVGDVDIWVECESMKEKDPKVYMKVGLEPPKLEVALFLKTDLELWLRDMGFLYVTNLTSEAYLQKWMQHDPRIKPTGRWMQFEENPLLEGVWELGKR